jgi:acyl-CoA reductase-like NAD-dependent aldehyde dehydrogenase
MRMSDQITDIGRFDGLIDGRLVAGTRYAAVLDPATEQVVGHAAIADVDMVARAVSAALVAQQRWRRSALTERRALLRRMADVLDAHALALARTLVLEQGKPIREARGEVDGAIGLLRQLASVHPECDALLFEAQDEHLLRHYSPLGVVAGIVPWNYPLLIAAMKVGPALLTGNAIIVKPAPSTPLTTLQAAELWADLVPSGLLQVLGDDGEVGAVLTAHPDVRKVAFTGSTLTGRRVMAAAAPTLKRITLELGGNDAAIVLADADIELAAEGLFHAAFTNCGQICGAAKRIYVHDSRFDAFCEALARRVRAVVMGSGLRPEVTMGPLQNSSQHEKAALLLASARQHGRIVASSHVPAGPGYFLPATLVEGLDESHPLVREEQFAPLLPIQRFRCEQDALDRANDTPYGLTASVWSGDRDHAVAVARGLDAAMVCINRHNDTPVEVSVSMSKQSGIGWLGGDEGLLEYLQAHTIVL